MQQNNPVFTYMIFLSALLAAILCLLVEIFGIRWFPKLLDAPYHFLYPAILALCLLGVYIETFNIANIIMACFFIAVGLYMMYAGIPTTPFILSFVLGSRWRTTSARPSATARVTGPCSSPVRSPASC